MDNTTVMSRKQLFQASTGSPRSHQIEFDIVRSQRIETGGQQGEVEYAVRDSSEASGRQPPPDQCEGLRLTLVRCR